MPLVQRVSRVGWVLAMFLCSLGSPVVNTTSTGLLQVLAPAEMRGPLFGIWMMVSFGTQPFAFLLIGVTGGLLGAPGAVLLNAAAMILAGSVLLVFRSGLRDWVPLPAGRQVGA